MYLIIVLVFSLLPDSSFRLPLVFVGLYYYHPPSPDVALNLLQPKLSDTAEIFLVHVSLRCKEELSVHFKYDT